MADHVPLIVIGLIALVVSVPISFRWNLALKDKEPASQSFRWGYLWGLWGLCSACLIVPYYGWQVAVASSPFDRGIAAAFITVALVLAPFFYLVLRRDKVGWIMSTLLSLNIVFWVANFIYIRSRWKELSWPFNIDKLIDWSNPLHGVFISGSLFWAFVAVAYAWLFEPYGSYMSSSERQHLMKVILFPPIMIFVGWLIWTRVVRRT